MPASHDDRRPPPAEPQESLAESLYKAFHRDFKVSGFTFVRNGVRYGYPFIESILSALPSVDEMIVNVGKSADGTLEKVRELAADHGKIRIIENEWDETLQEGGKILAQQTDLAMQACSGDWGLYLQADEVLHEDDIMWLLDALKRADQRQDVDGLLFDYLHFYGDFRVVNWNPSAYRREVRAVRLDRGIRSYGDAQGFRKVGEDGELHKLKVIAANSRIFHYGWVRPPEVMQEKTKAMDRLYHGDRAGTGDNYRYRRIYGLERYNGTHPMVMRPRIQQSDWSEDLLGGPLDFRLADIRKVLFRWWEKLTGIRPFEYRNYIRVD